MVGAGAVVSNSNVIDAVGVENAVDTETTTNIQTNAPHTLICRCAIPIQYNTAERAEALSEWPFPRPIDHRVSSGNGGNRDRDRDRVVNYSGPVSLSRRQARAHSDAPAQLNAGAGDGSDGSVGDSSRSVEAEDTVTPTTGTGTLTLGPSNLPVTPIVNFTTQTSMYEYRHVVECNVVDMNTMPKVSGKGVGVCM